MSSRLYFAYGSNLWLQQMQTRCPNSIKIGIAKLLDFEWIISPRGYANVRPSDDGHVAYGILYALDPSDEKRLDGYEGVPRSYWKVELEVVVEDAHGEKTHPVLVYIDPRQGTGAPRKEYIKRMRAGLTDASLPESWVRDNIEPWLKG
jgi:gamma-glutamylcyclotransferase